MINDWIITIRFYMSYATCLKINNSTFPFDILKVSIYIYI